MSQKTPNETVQNITSMPADESTANQAEIAQPSRAQRAKHFIKKHRTTLIAGALGVTLVGAGAYGGRKTAPLHLEVVDSETDIEPMLQIPSSESSDTVA